MTLKKLINKVLASRGYRIARIVDDESTHDSRYLSPSYSDGSLPEGVMDKLSPTNPRLVELRHRYAAMHHPAGTNPDWTERKATGDIDLRYFRGDNAYVYQYRSVGAHAELKYLLYAYYISTIDRTGLLSRLEEDGLFGAYTFDFNNTKVSRDLLDSIGQIYFLEDALGLSQIQNLTIIDIGAGYGRLAHRMCNALQSINMYYCADGVAESTFLSDFYLQYRSLTKKAKSVPLFDIASAFGNRGVDLAINIHSFSECPLTAITWWLDLIKDNRVKYFFLVPNPEPDENLLSTEINGGRLDYLGEIIKRGYCLVKKMPKFQDSSLQKLFHVRPVYYYLFELRGQNITS